MYKYFLPTLAMILIASGCGSVEKDLTEAELAKIPFAQKQDFPECSGGLVLTVGSETITANEIIAPFTEHFRTTTQPSSFEQFKNQVRPQLETIVSNKISNAMLYQQAKQKMSDNIDEQLEKAAKQEINKFIVGFKGDYARAEESLKQMGMDWDSFKEYQKKLILSQSYISAQLPQNEPITYSNLIKSYNEMKYEFFALPAMLQFRLIDIQPEKLQVTDPNQSRQQFAMSMAEDLIKQINQGKDFGELAKIYSHGHRRTFGGLWKPVQPESLAKPYDVLATLAKEIQPGQITDPITVPGHVLIMKLEQKQTDTVKPFEDVQKQIEAKIIFERRKQAIDQISEKLASQAELGNKSAFIDFCLTKIYQNSINGN
ncbi:MAG: peptidylprolyl isomerase [Planctomycetes bacterium]|nr:peptidylprolyl isomerase [Planctomycetota bacterium]